MARRNLARPLALGVLVAALALTLVAGAAVRAQDNAEPAKTQHVAEVRTLLGNLTVEEARTHKNMVVFPVRFAGRQAPGQWMTLDDAVAAGHLTVSEKDRASVPEVTVENTGGKTVLLMSGEIIKGGKQTRVVRKDTILEPKQKVAVAVFCVEQSRWRGGKAFTGARKMAPASIRGRIQEGAGQSEVWHRVQGVGNDAGVSSPTGSLEEMMEAEPVKKRLGDVHSDLGKFSPPDTVGIAVADARTGRVVGLELFGRRDLFDGLQKKLVDGYAMDLVVTRDGWDPEQAKPVTEDEVLGFITAAVKGSSAYEDTPGSGRGIDLAAGAIRGKGVALGDHAIHLSVQDTRPASTPAKPIVRPPVPVPQERLRSR